MCLIVKYDKKFTGNKGWKLLYYNKGKYRTGMMGVKAITVNQDGFTKANTDEIETSAGISYQGGFHIFTRKDDAQIIGGGYKMDGMKLCQVAFREQTAYGRVDWYSLFQEPSPKSCRTVVAKELKILEVYNENSS